MATVVLPRFSASTISVPDPDPDPLFTWFSDLLSVAPPPEPPDPPEPSDSFLPLCRPYIFEASASSRRSRSSFDDSALVSSGVQLSTALCSSLSCPILGENPWLPLAGPFAPCIKRSQGFSYFNKSLLLPWNEDVVLSLKLFLPQFEDVVLVLKLFLPQFEDIVGSVSFIMKLYLPQYEDITLWCTSLLSRQWSSSQPSDFLKQGFVGSEFVAVSGGLFPKLSPALNGVGTRDSVSKMVLSDAETMPSIACLSAIFDAADLLTVMPLETLMSLICEIVWNCQDAKVVFQALVGSALMVEALKLRSALLKAKELILLSFHLFSDSQVFIFTLRLGSVLNEIAGVLHDAVFLAKANLECMNIKNTVV
ncbi:hypothetical protein HID58_008565 [Brassica napus]|uniref:Uncharacterized protein n=1 Tax=Brassica napus TaxID=3708 RepID=A0ABQ8DRX6_BRANA|nr:hypothetical protein HID58_008565 [Brassica napus]